MKRLFTLLLVLSVLVGAFATTHNVQLNSTVPAGVNVGGASGETDIYQDDVKGYFISTSIVTDKNNNPTDLQSAVISAQLIQTATTSAAQGATWVDFIFKYRGSVAEAGSTPTITLSTDGFKGASGSAVENEVIGIALSKASAPTNIDYAVTNASEDEYTNNRSFTFSYPVGRVPNAVEVTRVKATWTLSDNYKAGNYSATVVVEVAGT